MIDIIRHETFAGCRIEMEKIAGVTVTEPGKGMIAHHHEFIDMNKIRKGLFERDTLEDFAFSAGTGKITAFLARDFFGLGNVKQRIGFHFLNAPSASSRLEYT
jgi:hypothetical protein